MISGRLATAWHIVGAASVPGERVCLANIRGAGTTRESAHRSLRACRRGRSHPAWGTGAPKRERRNLTARDAREIRGRSGFSTAGESVFIRPAGENACEAESWANRSRPAAGATVGDKLSEST